MRYLSIIVFLVCLLTVTPLLARPELPFKGKPSVSNSDDDRFQSVCDTSTELWLAHSNRMAVGRPFAGAFNVPDDREQTGNLPFRFGANFPGRSPGEYLGGAGLWVGGIKGSDTLVSHSFDFVNATPELIPPAGPAGKIISGPGIADMEHIALAYDTIIIGDTLFRCQLGDCNDWYPLGLEVRSHSYLWQTPPYDRTVIVEYTVKNIDTMPLEKGWVGIYADGDIGSGGDKTHTDDISGFLSGAIDGRGRWVDLDVGYSLDMNGDAGRIGYDDFTANGIFGIQVLGLTAVDYRVNFNWWVSESLFGGEYAPRQIVSSYRDLGGGMAAPRGDSNKYFVMSYPEIDFNQIESGLLHAGWVAPDEDGEGAAFGGDTRFVISAGPFDLQPSDSIVFTVAYIVGNNALDNSYIYTWFDPTDPRSISDYYEIMSPAEFKTSALAAAEIYEQGLAFPPPGPPDYFELISFDDDRASFVWPSKKVDDLAGYHLLARTADSTWIAAVLSADDMILTLTDLDPDRQYFFSMVSFDQGGAVGISTPEIKLRPGAPQPPQYLTGTARNARPRLHWTHSMDTDVEYYRFYRVEGSGDTIIVAETADTTYLDTDTKLACEYIYFVSAVSANGYESPYSPSLRLIPLMPSSGILAVNQNPGNILSNPVFDDVFFDSLLERSLGDVGYTYRRHTESYPLTLFDLAQYSLVIISAENIAGSLADDMTRILSDYLANGGKAILLLRHAAVDITADAESHVINHQPWSIFYNRFMIDSSYIGELRVLPGYQLDGNLIGADPVEDIYPSQSWDSVRVNSFGYAVLDGLPYAGYFWPHPPAEPIFTYRSADQGNPAHEQVNGIRYIGDDYSFYLLNFPLSLMEIDSAAAFLRAAVFELGENLICGDVNGDFRLGLADAAAYVGYLFRGDHPAAMDKAGDVNCDGLYSMDDLMILINYYFYRGTAPECCPPDTMTDY